MLTNTTEQLIGVKEICEALKIKPATFYSMKTSGTFGLMPLPFCRHLRYKQSEFDFWIKSGTPNRQRFQAMLKSKGGQR